MANKYHIFVGGSKDAKGNYVGGTLDATFTTEREAFYHEKKLQWERKPDLIYMLVEGGERFMIVQTDDPTCLSMSLISGRKAGAMVCAALCRMLSKRKRGTRNITTRVVSGWMSITNNLKQHKTMAKIGNFVGQGWLPIGQCEAKRIADYLAEQCRNVFGADYFDRFETVIDNKAWDYSTTGKRYAHVREMMFYAYVKHPIPEYRNDNADRIKDHTRVEFTVHKAKGGWLDVHNAKGELVRDYDNCPPFSYDCFVRADGREIVYGGRQENVIEPRYHYVYGTEVCDLDQTQALCDLRSMTNVCGVRKEYCDIWKLRKAA